MQIDVGSFVEQAVIGAGSNYETRFYYPRMLQDQDSFFGRFNRDSELPHIIMGRRILAHCYGEAWAVRFKRWIFSNYPIGNANGIYDAQKDRVIREVDDLAPGVRQSH